MADTKQRRVSVQKMNSPRKRDRLVAGFTGSDSTEDSRNTKKAKTSIVENPASYLKNGLRETLVTQSQAASTPPPHHPLITASVPPPPHHPLITASVPPQIKRNPGQMSTAVKIFKTRCRNCEGCVSSKPCSNYLYQSQSVSTVSDGRSFNKIKSDLSSGESRKKVTTEEDPNICHSKEVLEQQISKIKAEIGELEKKTKVCPKSSSVGPTSTSRTTCSPSTQSCSTAAGQSCSTAAGQSCSTAAPSDETISSSQRGEKSTPTIPETVSKSVMIRPKKIKSVGSAKHQQRMKKCGSCSGCLRSECGQCKSCIFNKEFKEKLKLGMAECLNKVCNNPMPLSYSNLDPEQRKKKGGMKLLLEGQDDGVCPFKVVNGELYDLRCIFCKKLPRAGCANRSELYRHYSLYHFQDQLKAEFGNIRHCPLCGSSGRKLRNIYDHMGQTHNHVEKYLPEEARIPVAVKGAGRKAKGPREKRGSNKNAFFYFPFPDIPDDYDPTTGQVVRELAVLPVNGVDIELNYDLVTLADSGVYSEQEHWGDSYDGEQIGVEDVEGEGCVEGVEGEGCVEGVEGRGTGELQMEGPGECRVCGKEFPTLFPIVEHLHSQHGIQGDWSARRDILQNLINSSFIILKKTQ